MRPGAASAQALSALADSRIRCSPTKPTPAQAPHRRRTALSLYAGSIALGALLILLSPPATAENGGALYRNSDGGVIDKGWSAVLRWRLHALFADQSPTTTALPVVHDQRATATAQAGELAVTWVGHATTLLRLDGQNILTDPQFSPRASPFSWIGPSRQTPLPFTIAALPHIDVVVISHNHYDHLDEASVLALNRQAGGPPLFLVPAGLADWFQQRGISNTDSLAWWQSRRHGALTATAVPAHHWSGRGLFDRNHSHWSGWVLRSGGHAVFFAGDTGYSADFKEIGTRLGPFDLALLPVGAYAPRDFMQEQHIDPDEAVAIHREVRAKQSLAIHWGTFRLSDEALDAPLRDLPATMQRAGLAEQAFRLLKHGETWQVFPPNGG